MRIRRYPSIYLPLPPPNFETEGGINTTFWLAGQIFRKSLKKKIAPAAGKILAFSLVYALKTPKFSRLRRAKSQHFPLYTPPQTNFSAPAAGKIPVFPLVYARTTRFFHACSESKHSLYSGKRCPIARRRRDFFFGGGLEVCTRGNPSDLARRRRENFDIRSGPDPKSQILRFEIEGG